MALPIVRSNVRKIVNARNFLIPVFLTLFLIISVGVQASGDDETYIRARGCGLEFEEKQVEGNLITLEELSVEGEDRGE